MLVDKFHVLIKSVFNPFPNKPWFLRVCSTSLLKTLWEKEKLLVTSNFSFSHIVFYPLGEFSLIFIIVELSSANSFNLGRVQNVLFGKGLICGLQIHFNFDHSILLSCGQGSKRIHIIVNHFFFLSTN